MLLGWITNYVCRTIISLAVSRCSSRPDTSATSTEGRGCWRWARSLGRQPWRPHCTPRSPLHRQRGRRARLRLDDGLGIGQVSPPRIRRCVPNGIDSAPDAVGKEVMGSSSHFFASTTTCIPSRRPDSYRTPYSPVAAGHDNQCPLVKGFAGLVSACGPIADVPIPQFALNQGSQLKSGLLS